MGCKPSSTTSMEPPRNISDHVEGGNLSPQSPDNNHTPQYRDRQEAHISHFMGTPPESPTKGSENSSVSNFNKRLAY